MNHVVIERVLEDLYKGEATLYKQLNTAEAASNQSATEGIKGRPISYRKASAMKDLNAYHSTCLEAKTSCTVGLGFVREEIGLDEVTGKPELEKRSEISRLLDPLCDVSFMDVLMRVAEDYWEKGNGYLEVKKVGDEITGLHWLPAVDTWAVVEDGRTKDRHYEVSGEAGVNLKFACFGDVSFKERNRQTAAAALGDSEVIPFLQPTTRSRWYGMIDWGSATPAIELQQMIHQHQFDFFLNRGVPELLISIIGEPMKPEQWEDFQKNLRNHIGRGKSHKTQALNFVNPETKVQVDKLGVERVDGIFTELFEVLSNEVVSGHGVPPLLAGILIPGKLGATNELPNALKAFQVLKIAPAQRIFTTMLQKTLGSVLPVEESKWEFRTILDEIDVGAMDTIARMRQPLPQAQEEGRDLDAGVRKIDPEEALAALKEAWSSGR